MKCPPIFQISVAMSRTMCIMNCAFDGWELLTSCAFCASCGGRWRASSPTTATRLLRPSRMRRQTARPITSDEALHGAPRAGEIEREVAQHGREQLEHRRQPLEDVRHHNALSASLDGAQNASRNRRRLQRRQQRAHPAEASWLPARKERRVDHVPVGGRRQ